MEHQNGWNVDTLHQRIWHESGLSLKILGELHEPDEVVPLVIPDQLSARRLVALIREGVELCRDYRDGEEYSPVGLQAYPGAAGVESPIN